MSPRLTIQPTELERENLHNLDVGDDYHLQEQAAIHRDLAAPPEEVIAQAGIRRIERRARR